MIQTATDLLAPAQSKISVKSKEASSHSGFAEVLEAEGLRLEEQPAPLVGVMELPISVASVPLEPEIDVLDIARFPASIFELMGAPETPETPEEEPEDVESADVEEIAAPELNVIAYAFAPPQPQPLVNEEKPIAREHEKFSPRDIKHVPQMNREIEIPAEFAETPEEPELPQKPVNIETKRDEPANVDEPVVVAAEAPKVVEPPKKSEKRAAAPAVKAETPEKAEAPEKAEIPEKAETPSPLSPSGTVPPLRGGLKTTLPRADQPQPPSEREVAPQATEGGRATPSDLEIAPREREKPEREALEKMPPEPHKREAAFTDFLTNIAETRTAPKPDGVAQQNPVPRAQPQFQLLNTGRAAFTEGLESVVRFARSEGFDRATLIVDPPALGKVSVEIISTAKGVEASLKVSSEQVRALVQDQIVQLKQALAQIGVQSAEFSVDVQQQDKQNEQAWQDQNLKNRRNNADKEDETQDDEEVFRVDLRKGLLHWVA